MITRVDKLLAVIDGLSYKQAVYSLCAALARVTKQADDPEVRRVINKMLLDAAEGLR